MFLLAQLTNLFELHCSYIYRYTHIHAISFCEFHLAGEIILTLQTIQVMRYKNFDIYYFTLLARAYHIFYQAKNTINLNLVNASNKCVHIFLFIFFCERETKNDTQCLKKTTTENEKKKELNKL